MMRFQQKHPALARVAVCLPLDANSTSHPITPLARPIEAPSVGLGADGVCSPTRTVMSAWAGSGAARNPARTIKAAVMRLAISLAKAQSRPRTAQSALVPANVFEDGAQR